MNTQINIHINLSPVAKGTYDEWMNLQGKE